MDETGGLSRGGPCIASKWAGAQADKCESSVFSHPPMKSRVGTNGAGLGVIYMDDCIILL